MKEDEKRTLADAIDIDSVIDKAIKKAAGGVKLTPVFLQRDSFAGTATSTGSLCLDQIMGGGVPPGRVVGIAGPEHAGKSLLATEVASNQLLAGRHAAYSDAEGGNDPLFLKARGIDFDKYRGSRNKNGDLKPGQRDLIHYYQPETGDQLLHLMHGTMSALPENRNATAAPIIFFLDSVVALISDAISNDIDQNKMAMHAKMYSEMLPIIQSQLSRSGCSFVYTNQLRMKPMVQFGSPEYEPAGDALKFFSAIRLRLSSGKPKLVEDKDHPFVGDGNICGATPRQGGVWEEPHYTTAGEEMGLDRYIYTAVRTVKNKVYNPQKVCWVRIQFENAGNTGSGLDKVYDVFTFLMNNGYLAKGDKKGVFKTVADADFDPVSVGIPPTFDYTMFKHWIGANPDITKILRDKLIVSGFVFKND